MARTNLTKTTAPGPYAHAGVAVTMTAADVVNMNQFTAGADDLLIVRNSDASAHTYTVTSAPDPYGRTKDITTESIAAGEIRIVRLAQAGWMQPDGKVYIAANNALVLFGIVALQ